MVMILPVFGLIEFILFEVETEVNGSKTVHFPKVVYCDDAPCVTVCPTGASYKREEDGIVLVNAETCIGCKLCSWACPYGAREYDGNCRSNEKMHSLCR